ncbi:hypothetical protein ANN_21200 [Periplaneta americana]|uniref:Uncharacterized protein n=1 Tax=Periplaneta americana TaxID=6978 RepID=A0ABQ8SFZ4_PERAM|nr:hypothetical protein ANN_21200 [Periplaneta americana]
MACLCDGGNELPGSLKATSKEASLREHLEDRALACGGPKLGRLGFDVQWNRIWKTRVDVQWNRIWKTWVRRSVEQHLEDLGSTCSELEQS